MDKGLIYNKRYCKNISKTQGSDGVGSIKCTLRKETKNDIAKFIDREFINEAIKEITIYIKTTNKVQIDDSNFNEKDSNSKVNIKEDGSFYVYDYTYVKDFIYELSWEGSYINELKENEYTGILVEEERRKKLKNYLMKNPFNVGSLGYIFGTNTFSEAQSWCLDYYREDILKSCNGRGSNFRKFYEFLFKNERNKHLQKKL